MSIWKRLFGGSKPQTPDSKQSDAETYYQKGSCYLDGEGVERDEVEALKWFRKSAALHYARSQAQVGDFYNSGKGGVAKDKEEAVNWFRAAAEQNYAYAQLQLGIKYAIGDGIEKNAAEAEKWINKAIAQNTLSPSQLEFAQLTLKTNKLLGL